MFSFLPRGNIRFWIAAIHTAVWIIYFSFLFTANRLANPSVKMGYAILSMIPYCLVFYVSLFWLNKYRRIGPFFSILSFIGTFVALGALAYAYMYEALPSANIHLYEADEFREFLKYAVLGYIQYYSYALLYYVIDGLFKREQALSVMREEKYIRELENATLKQNELSAQKDKLQIEYAFLRAQVNPHFLYNALNTLYSQAQEYSEILASNIVKLSHMMRYSFENIEYESDLVSVEKEVKNLNRLIDINAVRFEGEDLVDFRVEGEMNNQLLPPLSLITIVENAFKYGDLTNPKHPLIIRLRLEPGSIFFYCKNKMQERIDVRNSHNIGISNLKKRLDVLFGNKYTLNSNPENEFYILELTIKH